MICNRDAVEHLAGRIERAYRRRNPCWVGLGRSPAVWESAASRLLEVSIERPAMPVDPELYVAVLATGGNSPDPWVELTQRRSKTRYVKALRRIVGLLRRELEGEIRLASRRLLAGQDLDRVFLGLEGRLSPLACYILAFRAGRTSLAEKFRGPAENQHRACPLYRVAARSLLPDPDYPRPRRDVEPSRIDQEALQFSLN